MARQPPRPPSLETVLDTLRREAKHATRKPRAAIDAAVQQLLRSSPVSGGSRSARKQWRVDDLARAAGTTVRNVRAYQERGLLHPPRREGRVAYFDDSHLARLKLITSMLDRGYTSAHIAELLSAWENGEDLADVLGLEQLVRPWSPDEPRTMTVKQVRDLVGGQRELDRLVADRLVEISDSKAIVHRPRLIKAFAEMRDYGMPMDTVVGLHERVAPLLDDIARMLVETGAQQVAPQLPAPDQVSDYSVDELVTMMIRFRTLAMDSVTATLAHAIEQRVETLLGDYLAYLAGQPTVPADVG
jgi:DNA-binding transcriptional MerR regulator